MEAEEKLAKIIAESHGYVFPSGDDELNDSFKYWAGRIMEAGYLPVEPIQLEEKGQLYRRTE